MPRTSRKPRVVVRSVTSEEFDAALLELLEDSTPAEILAVPGVYEALSEAWNNEAIKLVEDNRE